MKYIRFKLDDYAWKRNHKGEMTIKADLFGVKNEDEVIKVATVQGTLMNSRIIIKPTFYEHSVKEDIRLQLLEERATDQILCDLNMFYLDDSNFCKISS